MLYRIALYFQGAKFSRIAILKLIRGINFSSKIGTGSIIMNPPINYAHGYQAMVRGYHVYQVVWAPTIGEELPCRKEHGNIPKIHTLLLC